MPSQIDDLLSIRSVSVRARVAQLSQQLGDFNSLPPSIGGREWSSSYALGPWPGSSSSRPLRGTPTQVGRLSNS